MRTKCEARQYSDQKVCNRCGLIWDMNDPEPPSCLTDEEINRRKADEALKNIRGVLRS